MLPYYARMSGRSESFVTCKTSPASDWKQSIACYRDTMIKLGFALSFAMSEWIVWGVGQNEVSLYVPS